MEIEMESADKATQPLAKYAAQTGVCILAAGIAKRLEPISDVIAKPAFPLAGRVPILELWVRKFVTAGISRIAMNLHKTPDSIRSHFGDGKQFLADLTYVYEPVPTGTLGGAIKMLREFKKQGFVPKRVFIPSGDIVSNIGNEHLERMMTEHIKRGAAATLMLAPIPWHRRGDFGTVALEGVAPGQPTPAGTFAKILDFREKEPDSPSNENNASNYLVETDFLFELEPYLTPARIDIEAPCYDFGKHVFMGMKGKVEHLSFLTRHADAVYGYEPGTLWFDVGNKRDYLDVNKAVLNKQIPMNIPYCEYPWGWMGRNVEIDLNKVSIRGPVLIGDNCTIHPGAEIGPNVVLGNGWTCHQGSRLSDAVLWPDYSRADSADPRLNAIREIRRNVNVNNAIIVAGDIATDIVDKTVHAQPDGTLDIRSIDWIPSGNRA